MSKITRREEIQRVAMGQDSLQVEATGLSSKVKCGDSTNQAQGHLLSP